MYDWHPHTVKKLFERVNIEDLADDQHDRTCKICEKPYEKGPEYTTSEPWTRLPIPAEEDPVRLACGHIFGESCIQLWTFPKPFGSDCNSCPLCREPVFVLSDVQEMLYQEELDNFAADGCLIEDYTIVDFLCTWIEGEEEYKEERNGGTESEMEDVAAVIEEAAQDGEVISSYEC